MSSDNEKPKQMRFLCCTKTMPFERTHDLAGFLVCPEHQMRRYGWRSPRITRDRPRGDFGTPLLEQDQTIAKELFGE
jgi:hypothetical protein